MPGLQPAGSKGRTVRGSTYGALPARPPGNPHFPLPPPRDFQGVNVRKTDSRRDAETERIDGMKENEIGTEVLEAAVKYKISAP